MSGVTKLIVIFDENNIIAILNIHAPKQNSFAVTLLIERPPKAEVRRQNKRDTAVAYRKCQVHCKKL